VTDPGLVQACLPGREQLRVRTDSNRRRVSARTQTCFACFASESNPPRISGVPMQHQTVPVTRDVRYRRGNLCITRSDAVRRERGVRTRIDGGAIHRSNGSVFMCPTSCRNTQQLHLRASSVIDSETDAVSIESAIRTALSGEFRESAKAAVNPYGTGGASQATLHASRPLRESRC